MPAPARKRKRRQSSLGDTPAEVANVLKTQRQLNYPGGTLVAAPIPLAEALPQEDAEAYIEEAIRRADAKEISGAALTPFLLSQIVEISNGLSVVANRALLLNNCRVAAQIAAALAEREAE